MKRLVGWLTIKHFQFHGGVIASHCSGKWHGRGIENESPRNSEPERRRRCGIKGNCLNGGTKSSQLENARVFGMRPLVRMVVYSNLTGDLKSSGLQVAISNNNYDPVATTYCNRPFLFSSNSSSYFYARTIQRSHFD